MDNKKKKRILNSVQTEYDTGYLYEYLAKTETDTNVKKIYKQMSSIEYGHAKAMLKKLNVSFEKMSVSIRVKIILKLSTVLGRNFLIGTVLEAERKLSQNILDSKKNQNLSTQVSDTAHVRIMNNILNSQHDIPVSLISKFEKRHRSIGGNALRAAVLGGNDGLVSNFGLVMGVAGAASSNQDILLTGSAGLLAGALSMALGEWISVKSSQELIENQIQLESDELEYNPEGEARELVLIYMSKGISQEESERIVNDIMQDKDLAREVLIREELGITQEDLKDSALEAAVTSFILFGFGAIIPLIPFFFFANQTALVLCILFSAIGLFFIGALITIFTGKGIVFSGMRQVIFGLIASAITFGIGHWIGISLLG